MIIDRKGTVYHLGSPIGRLGGSRVPSGPRAPGAFDGALGAFGGEWETWCDQGGTEQKYGGEAWVCKYGSGWPVNPFLAPWTDVGNLTRVLVAGAWPSDEEMEPYSLMTLPILRPWRFAYIVWLAKLLAVTPLSAVGAAARAAGYVGVPIDQVPFVRSLAGLGSLPGIGVLPGGTHPEIIGLTAPGWLIAIGDTLRRFGPQGVYDKIVDPIVNKGGAEGILALTGGIPGIAAYAIRREAERMGPTSVRAILLAISRPESAVLFAKFQNPITFRNTDTFTGLGNAIQYSVAGVPGDVAYALGVLGRGLVTFSMPLAYLARSELVTAEDALDDVTFKTLGIKFSRFKQIKNNATELNKLASTTDPRELEQSLEFLRIVAEWIGSIFDAINHVINSPAISWALKGELSDIAAMLTNKVRELFGDVIRAGQQVLNPPIHVAEPVQPTASIPATRTVVPAKSITIVQPPPTTKPKAPGIGGPTAAGAGIGLVVGGPPGSLIGAGAGLIYGLVRKPK